MKQNHSVITNFIKLDWRIYLFLIIPLMFSCIKSEKQNYIFGSWEGMNSISTRYLNASNNFVFINDSVPINITINKDSIVTGYIGNSRFIKCKLSKNTGLIGKVIHMGTEVGIIGFISGRFNKYDTCSVKIINIPFTNNDSLLSGTIFMRNTNEMLPLVYELKLRKNK
jgi:hypothetical protein